MADVKLFLKRSNKQLKTNRSAIKTLHGEHFKKDRQ